MADRELAAAIGRELRVKLWGRLNEREMAMSDEELSAYVQSNGLHELKRRMWNEQRAEDEKHEAQAAAQQRRDDLLEVVAIHAVYVLVGGDDDSASFRALKARILELRTRLWPVCPEPEEATPPKFDLDALATHLSRLIDTLKEENDRRDRLYGKRYVKP